MNHYSTGSQLSKGNNLCSHHYPKAETMATKRLKICFLMSSILFIIVAIVLVTLILTMFKPKNPDIFIHPTDLENFQLFSPNSTSAPLGMVVTIVNRNYGSFKYINSTGYLKYRNTIIAEVPFVTDSIPARSTINVSTSASIMTGKLVDDSNFWTDIEGGVFNLTSKITLPGKVTMIKIFKIKAKVYVSCDISFNITAVNVGSNCVSKIKL